MRNNDSLEVEVKFWLADLSATRQTLIAAGGQLSKARVFERNVIYDDSQRTLFENHKLIRLRRDERVRLTFKGPSKQDQQSEAKVREEIEVEVDDFGRMEEIIGRLGLAPQLVYEKYRETFQLGAVEVVLDQMPYGDFIEFEGAEAEIKSAAQSLGFDWSQRITANYLSMMRLLKTRYELPFDNITFDNFPEPEFDWENMIQIL